MLVLVGHVRVRTQAATGLGSAAALLTRGCCGPVSRLRPDTVQGTREVLGDPDGASRELRMNYLSPLNELPPPVVKGKKHTCFSSGLKI